MRRTLVAFLTASLLTVGLGVTATSAAAADLGRPTDTRPQSGVGTDGGLLVGIRVGQHRDYDRVVFDIKGPLPPWDVRYVPRLVDETTGRVFPVRGEQVLRVRFEAASRDSAGGTPAPQILTPELPTLRQVQRSVQAEVVTEYGLGLRDRVGFRVSGLANPTRLVVDVAHQPSQPFGSEQVTISGPHSDVMVYGIRTGRHPGYDRVVFDLRGNAPRDLVVGYDGAGAVIQVVMFAGFRPENFHATYTGPPSVAVGLPAIRNVAQLPVHAGEGAPELLGFSIDTRHRHGFRVFILSGAGRTRLVVDAAV